MNRRSLLSLIPASMFTLACSAKTKDLSSDPSWVLVECQHHIDIDGKYQLPPSGVELFKAKIDSFSDPTINVEEVAKKHEEYRLAWANSPICGAHFKRLLGTVVRCPKCGGNSSGNRDTGVLYHKEA